MSAKHNFDTLFDKYPETISQMKDTFTSHEFILRLAQQNQVEYIKALNDYVDSRHSSNPTPFQFVHGRLAVHLNELPDLVVKIGDDPKSKDIFGNVNFCAIWQKVEK